MTVLEVLAFGLAVQLSAGVVIVINVVMSRLEQDERLNRPGFHAPSVMCERPVGRHGLSHSSWLRLRSAVSGRGGASAGWCCTSAPSRQ